MSVGADVLASVYLAPERASAWGWAREERVLAWVVAESVGEVEAEAAGVSALDARGPTIAYQAEVALVLARLAPDGLPSFQAVALVLAACRDGWIDAADPAFARLIDDLERAGEVGARHLAPRLAAAWVALERVTELPPALRTGPEAKAALVAAILERAPRRIDPEDAGAVARALEQGFEPASSPDALGPGLLQALEADLGAITAGLATLPGDALAQQAELRRRTGLDALVAPAAIDLEAAGGAPSDAERAARLLDLLRGDEELGGLARLARDLRAAVHVPRPVSAEDELPLGGVSDIANRGSLDRLLTSELAHDELTFAVRVATGEALYLRREAPPRAPTGGRAVLVDQGVRLWGVGRLFATAVALAAAATAGRRTRVRAFRPAPGEGVAPADLLSREGLVELLSHLDGAAHPGAALAAFVAAAGADDDLVLVTHEDALHDPPFERALAALLEGPLQRRTLWAATVDRHGEYRLRAVLARGRKAIARATLDLADVLAPAPGRPSTPPRPPGEPRLPLILSQEPFPLLLPHALDPARTRVHPRHGVVSVTRDGRVLHWPAEPAGLGARQLTDHLPARPLVGLEVDDAGRAWVVLGQERGVLLLRVELYPVETTEPVRHLLHGQLLPDGVARHAGALLLIHAGACHVDVVNLETGVRLAPLHLPADVAWLRGRIVRTRAGWAAIGWDGVAARLDPLGGVPPDALLAWEREGHEGASWLRPDGTVGSSLGKILPLVSSDPKPSLTDPTLGSVLGVSQDGQRLLVRRRHGPGLIEWLDLVTCSRTLCNGPPRHPGDVAAWLDQHPLSLRTQTGQQLRTRLHGVALDAQGRLALVSRRRRVHIVDTRPAGGLVLATRPAGVNLRALRPFEDHPRFAGSGFDLRVATWPDGSRAILDGRGLLHLQSARPGPELTLVLAEPGPLAAWTSDGGIVGPTVFTGLRGSLLTTEAQVLAHIARFADGIR